MWQNRDRFLGRKRQFDMAGKPDMNLAEIKSSNYEPLLSARRALDWISQVT